MSQKHSTSTLTSDGWIVPWLAAEGALAYTPESPPARDYSFQYGWVLPKVIASERKRHYYFGACHKSEADEVLQFWNEARAGQIGRVAVRLGRREAGTFTTPIAVYRQPVGWDKKLKYIFIQHGSYQVIEQQAQPLVDQGFVILWRGIETATEFRHLQFDIDQLSADQRRAWSLYCEAQWRILSDSATSFMAIHDSVVRCETGHLHTRTDISEKIAKECGLDLSEGGIGDVLWGSSLHGFSLEKWVAEKKFGPNWAAFRTPLDNIRITTFFAGESEVRVVDPSKLQLLETCGCKHHAVPF